jgi:hypothetical protein
MSEGINVNVTSEHSNEFSGSIYGRELDDLISEY